MTKHQMPTEPGRMWNGVPEVTASGSPWEIGFRHGSQVPDRIAKSIANYKKLFLETADADWPTSTARASKYLEYLRQNEPDLVEEMQGVAAGSGVDFKDILTLNLRSEISLTNYSDGCTSVATVNSGNNVYLSQNWDWVGEAGTTTVFFDIHKTGKPRIRMMGEAGILGKFGFNEHGLGLCQNAIRCGTVSKTKLPVHLAVRRVLECNSFAEALSMLQSKGVASCVSLTIADRGGNYASVECTPKGLAVLKPEPGERATFHTNHLWAPNVPQGIRDHPSKNSFDRLDRIRLLSKGRDDADMEMIRRWMSDEEGSPVSICRSVPPGAVGIERMETLATIIMDLKASKAELSFGRPSLSPPVRTITI